MPPSPPATPRFLHDRPLKAVFAEPDVVRDLFRFHAAQLLPELQGYEPLELVGASTVTAVPDHPPHYEEMHRDMVWTAAPPDQPHNRVLLHLEFQSSRDAGMTVRMVRYARGLHRHWPQLEVFGLVVNTGNQPFGTWWRPVQSVPGSHGYRFEEGALLDIHDYEVPAFPVDDHPLPPESLVTGIVLLARIQAALHAGDTGAAEQLLPLLRDWLIPRALRSTETLREALAAWFKAAFGDLLRDHPELRRALGRITYIEEAEAVMNMLDNILAAKEREGKAEGLELGKAQGLEIGEARGLERGEARGLERGEKRVLLRFVAHVWGDDEAERFARQLDTADRSRFPEITDLMADHAEGRLPRLRHNGRTDSSG